jgi:hypothetical protein
MDYTVGMRRSAGALLAVGGLGLFLAGAVHPQGATGTFSQTMASMLASPTWPIAHWLAIGSALTILWAVWLLVDSGWTAASTLGHLGARLVLLAGLFMAVEFAVELAAIPEAAAYAAGASTPMGRLVESMQAVGWPAFMLGFVLLIAGLPTSAPAAVRLAGAIGATAMGLGGLLTEGLHLVAVGPLFIGGNLLALWLVWAGVVVARHAQAAASNPRRIERREPALTA